MVVIEEAKMILELTDKFANDVSTSIETMLIEEKLDVIKTSNGRKRNSPDCCRKSSSIYFLYDDKDEIIYIGETGTSVKHRLYTDGSGSHCRKNWFTKVNKLKYYKNSRMDVNSRKTIERALIQKYKPKYNDKQSKKN